MKKMNKLVALLLAAVMVLGLMPTMTVHANEYHTHGIEEYPALEEGVESEAVIEAGEYHYFTFTPSNTTLYRFVSLSDIDTKATLYDADMNYIGTWDDCYSHGHANGRNFCVEYTLEAGKTYILEHSQYYQNAATYNVLVTHEHSYVAEVTTPATCESDGVMTYTCGCGESYTEAIPAAHEYDENGKCIHCGETYLITGTCGDALTWELDWFGTLTIKGEGAMYDYVYNYNGDGAAPWYVGYSNSIKNVVVEEGVTSIGNDAFYYCGNIESVSLPSTLTSIGSNAFTYCRKMENVTLPEGLTSIGSMAFYNCSGQTEVVIPDSVTEIGESAYNGCYNLTSVKLPAGLTRIPSSMFANCSKLTSVEWPTSLETIGNNAFQSCNGLKELVLPEGLTTIEDAVFQNCYSINTITLPSTVTSVGGYAFASAFGYSGTNVISFSGNAPTFGNNVFSYSTVTAYYPGADETWTEDVLQQYGGSVTWIGLCDEHTWSEWATVDATCTTGSYETRTCSVCGLVENTAENEDALGHDEVVTVVPPDCATYASGYTLTTCTRCDLYEQTDWVYAEHDNQPVVTEPTCTEGGYTDYVCSVCGYSSYWLRDGYTEALGHNVEEWSEPSELTCEEDSVKTGTCTRCEETFTEVVEEATGHVWDEENPVENEDGSLTYTCTVCGASQTTESPYLYLGDNVFSIAARTPSASKTFTAEETGTLTITTSDMYYVNNYSGQWTTLAIDWAFREGMFTIAINDVVAEYTIEGSELAAKIITSVEVEAGDVVTVTLNHDASKTYYYSSDVKVNMNLALEAAEPEVVDLALGDNVLDLPVDATVNGAWTAEADGTLTVKLASVYYHDDFMTELLGDYWMEIPVENALANRYYTLTVNGEAVTAAEGVTVDVAAGDVVTVAVGNAYGYLSQATVNLTYAEPHVHAFGDWAVTTEPTCTEAGVETRTCECGETETREVPATGHAYESVVTEPTCTEAGYTTWTCANCGDSYTDSETEATGHSWKGTKCLNCDATRENPFVDVPEDSFYIDPVLWAVEKEITNGIDDTHFAPDANCMRAAVVTFLWRAAGFPEPTTTENPFVDVEEGDYFYKPVLWAVENGITNGIDATHFGPTVECNRATVVTFLYRAMGNPDVTATESGFTDVTNPEAFYYDAVLWAVENAITNGMGDGTFGINKICNRAQVVTFLYRVYN